ncbi:hypothetical protein O181_067433 [Austropuccinia psidii MF-1]|uniref:Integrase catalytic domain-containing protein n=1 Tax=Austropuccinia psidii MF-1 TaxID=1389203 RepID=A0A9Q3ETC6_9BASI|nr:hypothetical protein [Austropuccinia psidii MF-1]
MTIIYKERKIHTNSDLLSRWPMENGRRNLPYDPAVSAKTPTPLMEIDRGKNFRLSEWELGHGNPETNQSEPKETETLILGISSSELHNKFFNQVIKAYYKNKQCNIVLQLLQQKYRSPELESQLEEHWLRDYNENTLFLIDGLLYHREKHTSTLTVIYMDHVSLILPEGNDFPYMGHMSEERTKQRVARTAWWPQWEKEFRTQEHGLGVRTCPRRPRNLQHFPVIVDRYSKGFRFLQCHKEDTAMYKAVFFWNKIIATCRVHKIIISDRDPNFTSDVLNNLYDILGAEIVFYIAYHPQTDGLAERMIQILKDIIQIFCEYGMEYKDHEGYTHELVIVLPEIQLANNTSQHSITGKFSSLVEKGWNQLKKNLLNIHPTAKEFHNMWKRACDSAEHFIAKEKEYNKQRFDKTHKEPDFREGDQELVSILNLRKLRGPKKMRDSFVGQSTTIRLIGKNAVEVRLTEEFSRKY